MAVDSIMHHLEADSGYYIGEDGKGTYGPPKHPKLNAKTTKALLSRLPFLIDHLIKPMSAHWVNIDAYPYSEIARNRPEELTTAVGASRILNSLINRNKTNKAGVRKAFKAAGPRLQKIYSGNQFGDLDSDVYLLAPKVTSDV